MRIKVSAYVADKLSGLNKKAFRVHTFRGSGPGGQHRNKADTGVRITHLATGINAVVTKGRSQTRNKKDAFRILVNKLIAYYTKEEIRQRSTDIKMERIRTYHGLRKIVKDHRTGVEADYVGVLDGDIDCFIDALIYSQIE